MEQSKILRVQIRPMAPRKYPNGNTNGHSNGNGHAGELADTRSFGGDGEAFVQDSIPALDTLSRLLSQRNVELLRLIRRVEPQSVAELARLSGRPKASLMLTLRRLAHFGIVTFEEVDGRRKVPRVACDKLMLEVALDPIHGLVGGEA
ncbi:MAG: hypothetical protein NW205_09925 [Hyphomicrobiaceae bacterium]|nr:hypothetical protein [Hyphomicrobiaceae bacterium]